MDDLAARSKCRSVRNCESHFATEIWPVCAKMGVVVKGGGGGGGMTSHTWTFLENYNSQALDKVNVPPPPPKKKKKKKKNALLSVLVFDNSSVLLAGVLF